MGGGGREDLEYIERFAVYGWLFVRVFGRSLSVINFRDVFRSVGCGIWVQGRCRFWGYAEGWVLSFNRGAWGLV